MDQLRWVLLCWPGGVGSGTSWLLPALGMAPMGPARLAGPSHKLTGTASAERKARRMRLS